MKKYTIILGLNDQNSKQQEISTLNAYKIINNIIFDYCDGATITENKGLYRHDDGTIIEEISLNISIMFAELISIEQISEKLKLIFNQESVIIQTEEINSILF